VCVCVYVPSRFSLKGSLYYLVFANDIALRKGGKKGSWAGRERVRQAFRLLSREFMMWPPSSICFVYAKQASRFEVDK